MSMRIGTYTGKVLHLDDLKVDDICIEDIAWSLSNTNRFNGHCPVNIDVATHSYYVADMAAYAGEGDSVVRSCLMHDAVEAYIGDIVYDIKQKFPGLQDLEQEFQRLINEKFQLDEANSFRVEIYDRLAGRTECKVLMPHLYEKGTETNRVYEKFLGKLLLNPKSVNGHHMFMAAFNHYKVGQKQVLTGEIV